MLQENMTTDKLLKETIEVSSSAIYSAAYDHEDKSLLVTFVSGVCYVYDNVDYNDFILLKHSNSIGSFFNKHIKNKYVWEICK